MVPGRGRASIGKRSTGHEKGFISNPRGKAKSVVFTQEGLLEARRLLEQLFSAKK
jgi:hypothetical protein